MIFKRKSLPWEKQLGKQGQQVDFPLRKWLHKIINICHFSDTVVGRELSICLLKPRLLSSKKPSLKYFNPKFDAFSETRDRDLL